jgi:hypothetical protein
MAFANRPPNEGSKGKSAFDGEQGSCHPELLNNVVWNPFPLRERWTNVNVLPPGSKALG